jgi:hypothetical protein
MPNTRSTITSIREALVAAGRIARADEWWVNKLCPVLGVAYATAYQLDLALAGLWPALGFLVASLVAVGSYANLLNDLCDIRDDQLCGKPNRLAGRSPLFRAAALGAVLLPGVLAAWALWPNTTLLTLYLGIWVVFTFYSLPPVRLKARGFPGVLADAAGAHVLPQLFGIHLVAAWGREAAPAPAWVAAVAAWSLGRGVRGILWHQLKDHASDSRAGVGTFARRRPQRFVRLLGERLWFPLEVAGLAAMLALSGAALGWVLLAVHLLLESARCRLGGAALVIVVPRQGYFRFALDEYYVLFFPLTFLLGASWRNPADLVVLAVHMLLFPRPVRWMAREVFGMARVALGRGRRWVKERPLRSPSGG